MSILASRLAQAEREKQPRPSPPSAGPQVGTGMRNERIRTYNFPQGRLTITASASPCTSSIRS